VQQRDRGNRRGASEIGDNARRTETKPIDHDSAEEGREDDRQEVEEHDQTGQSGAAGRRQDVPRDRELRDGIAREGDGVRDVERRRAAIASAQRHVRPSLQSAAL
jgi:hypothetical protein